MTNHRMPESVWDYPRPPRLEPSSSHVQIVHRAVILADTHRALRVLETSHPPVYYLPAQDLRMDLLLRAPRRSSFCEFKGAAIYWSLDLSLGPGADAAEGSVEDIAWSYPDPTPAYVALRGHLAFYASRVDECTVDGERVQAQAGDFYGGWITSEIQGPFKGPPGTRGW